MQIAPASAAPTPGAQRAPSPLFEPSSPTARGFDFRQFWHSLVEKLWVVALCVVAGLFLALGYLARTPKLYQSHAVIEVEFQEPTVVTGDENASRMRSMFLASQEALRTIEQNLTNRSLLARVIRAEGLADDGGRALLGKSAITNPPAKPAPRTAPSVSDDAGTPAVAFSPLEESLAGALAGMVKPVIRRGTRLIDLYVSNRDPAMAQRLAEAVGREYIRNSIERRAVYSQESLRYMLEEEERLKTNLQKSEAAVADYKAKTPDALQLGGGTAATGSQSGAGSQGGRGGMVEDRLQELNSKLTAAKSERLRLEGQLEQVQHAGDNIDALLAIPTIASSPVVAERRREIAQIEGAVASLSQRYKEKHPRMMAAKAALAESKEALRRIVLNEPALMRNAIDQAKGAEAALQAASSDQEKAAIALNKAAIGYQELARQAETDRALYESVLRQIKATDLTKGVKANAVSVIEHATVSGAPVSPNASKSIALGLLGGLALGLGFVGGSDALDRSLKTVDQAETVIGLPVLAAIPEVKPGAAQKKKSARDYRASANYRLVSDAPEDAGAESFRNLRAALSLLGPEVERRVFLFTSAVPGEGKSFTSANYALSLSQQGHRVLLIDGDLRRPGLEKVFAQRETFAKDLPGIVDYLVGSATLAECVRELPFEKSGLLKVGSDADKNAGDRSTTGHLSALIGGRRAPNPAELLSGPSFAELVAEASRTFDRVVIDSAPILAVSDTLLMAPLAQTLCVVIRASKTPRNAVLRALTLLATTGVRPAGLVLNRLPRRKGGHYYYYYASHGYGAGEGAYTRREEPVAAAS